MNTKDEALSTERALKLALEALQTAHLAVEDDMLADEIQQAITAIREALAEQPTVKQSLTVDLDGLGIPHGQPFQPAQQPYDTHAAPGQSFDTHSRMPPNVPAARASKQWVGLTDEEILEVWCIHLDEGDEDEIEEWRHVINEAREIEAKLREKNEHREKNA
jgi:hypothetical protein